MHVKCFDCISEAKSHRFDKHLVFNLILITCTVYENNTGITVLSQAITMFMMKKSGRFSVRGYYVRPS